MKREQVVLTKAVSTSPTQFGNLAIETFEVSEIVKDVFGKLKLRKSHMYGYATKDGEHKLTPYMSCVSFRMKYGL